MNKLTIVIHCLGMPFNGDTVRTASLGGSESAAYYLARGLANSGHTVIVYNNTKESSYSDGVNYEPVGPCDERARLGANFHRFAENVPHDVLIIQRHPDAFSYMYASKVNILWLHDLALHRSRESFARQMWNIQNVWCVSEFHKKQVCDVYGFNPTLVNVVPNGIDPDLYSKRREESIEGAPLRMIYSSRPERGLENLVRPGGIVDQLNERNFSFTLFVCAYENPTPQMSDLYAALDGRCKELKNVVVAGSLSKVQLAELQLSCDMWVYPTSFEEVSCITAMEAMASGLRIVASDWAALPETLLDYPHKMLIPLNADGTVNIDWFVYEITNKKGGYTHLNDDGEVEHIYGDIVRSKLVRAWGYSTVAAEAHLLDIYSRAASNKVTVATQLLRNSDIVVLNKLLTEEAQLHSVGDQIAFSVNREVVECYDFWLSDNFAKHYADYYQYELDRGQVYGPESLENNSRFQTVLSMLTNVLGSEGGGKVVCDIGCAHGHYTINLAKRFPNTKFIGVDIAQSNVDTAIAWAAKEGLTNVDFICDNISKDIVKKAESVQADVILACEVLEHVGNPIGFLRDIESYAAMRYGTTTYIITTPYGPWEAQGYKAHWPWRAHLWHFDKADIESMFGSLPSFALATVPAGRTQQGEVLGSYVYKFSSPLVFSGMFTDRLHQKVNLLMPQQTLTLCMIVRNGEADLKKCLDAAIPFVDQVVIALDNTTNDETMQVIERFRIPGNPPITIKHIESPLKIGFDAARNESIVDADGDWILWLDADEVLQNGHNIRKYLKYNMFDGYALAQHHFAVEPLGVLKTDLPCRIFRNNNGIKFYGVVHEHPEKELNKGPGFVQVIGDVSIAHSGYPNEKVRRARFMRNIDLMRRDRMKYPERLLGKFLWVRDLAQMIQYDLEQTGGRLLPQHRDMALEGIKLWEELVKADQVRMILDGMQYYSALVSVLGTGFDFSMAVKGSKLNGGAHLTEARPISAKFLSREHLNLLMGKLVEAETMNYDSKYF